MLSLHTNNQLKKEQNQYINIKTKQYTKKKKVSQNKKEEQQTNAHIK